MSEFDAGSQQPLSPEHQAEMYQMVGRVATVYALLDAQPHVTTFNPETTRRGLMGRLLSETLPDGRTVHIGLIAPSQADTLEASEARHPVSHPPTPKQEHYEIWLFPRQNRAQPTENYRFYQGTASVLPRIVEPKADGKGLRSLSPALEKRWGHLKAIVTALEERTRG